MKLAVLGDHPSVVELARSAVALGHEIGWVGESGEQSAALAEVAPAATLGETWDALLNLTAADGLLAGWSELGEEHGSQLRLLCQSRIPLLVAHPLNLSMLIHFELDMVRAETRGVLRHYNPGRYHPALAIMRDLIRCGGDSPIGVIEQVVGERSLRRRSKDAVLAAFARDADLATTVAGQVDQVSALGTGRDAGALENLAVQMTTPAGLPIRWSVGPALESEGGQLALLGSAGRAVLSMPDTAPWQWTVTTSNGDADEHHQPAWEPAKAAIVDFVQAIDTNDDDGSDWNQASHTVELIDAIERSVVKGRAIQLYFEEHSEQSTFKGIMSALGCGVLMFGLTLLLLVALLSFLGRATGIVTPLVRYWPWLLLFFLVVYLLLQLLPHLVFVPERKREGQPPAGERPPGAGQ